jgi:peptide subunit release factor 1 (eRF1)
MAAFEPGPYPVISLYLNLQPNERGRDHFEPFLRKELGGRLRTFEARGPQRESLEADARQIRDYVGAIDGSENGLALFACSGAKLFEAAPMAAPIEQHEVHVSRHPHLYPLARVISEYPRYAIVLADTRSARIEVWAGNAPEHVERVEAFPTKHHKMGGWAQARYQRHAEHFHLHHAKDIVEALERLVREESIESILMAGDEVILPFIREQLPRDLADRVIDCKLDVHDPERRIVEAALARLRERELETDRERVDSLIETYRGNGLASVGVEDTRRALEIGQVDELIVSDAPSTRAALEELVAKAAQTSARIHVIGDPTLLQPIGGVGASLRFKLPPLERAPEP